MSIIDSPKYSTTRPLTFVFQARPEFIAACDDLAQKLQLTSRAQLALAALEALAAKHNIQLPPRLHANTRY